LFSELKQGIQAPENTPFNVASLTKPVVAITVLRLVNAGMWNLDESLDSFWIDPDVKDDPRHKLLTTRIILSHQTGFPNWRDKKLNFKFTPGTGSGYSGEGYEYLRHAVESKFGKKLQALSDSLLFHPLGLKDTRYGWQQDMDTSRYAIPHDKTGNIINITRHETANAADWLVTTVADYGRFGAYVLQGAGISEELFNDMATPQSKNIASKNAMGLGWEIEKKLFNGEYALLHTGHDPGVSSMIVLLPQSKRGLVLLSNGDSAWKLFINIVNATFHIEGLTP